MLRTALCCLLLAVLAACSSGDMVTKTPPAGYLTDAQARVAAVDWSYPKTVEVQLTEFSFSPDKLSFDVGKPYRLVLRNVGSVTHTFASKDFFQAVAVQKLVSSEGEQTLPYIEQIEIAPGTVKEIYFVPVTAGSYPFRCSVFLHASFGMTGEITIS